MGILMKQKSVFAAIAALGLSAAVPASAAVVVSGTGIGNTITTNAVNQAVTFSYDYITADDGTAAMHNFAYYTFNNNAFTLAGANTAVNTTAGIARATNPLAEFGSGLKQTGVSSTDFQTFTFNVPTPGTYNFGLGVASADTSSYAALLVDNIRVGGNLIAVGANDGSFENPDTDPAGTNDLFPYQVAGNAGIQLSGGTNVGGLVAPNGSFFAFLLNQPDGSLSSSPPAAEPGLATATNTSSTQLNALSTTQNPAATAVPLPAAAYAAPLGLVVAGFFAARSRRTAAC